MNAFAKGFMGCLGVGAAIVFLIVLAASLRPTLTVTPVLATASSGAIVVSAQASTPPGATPTPTPHIGSVVESGNWRYSVRQVDTATELDVSTSQFFRSVLKPKGLFVIVLVQLTNIGNRNFSINSFDFELRDTNGIAYDPSSDTFRLVSFRQQTQLGEQMPPGVLLHTTLLFDVAPGTNGMVLWLRQANSGIRLE